MDTQREITPDPVDLAETRAALIQLARRGFGRVAPERIADHVVAICEGADWPVRKAALEALGRRYSFAGRDGLRVAARPRGTLLGEYRTKRADEGAGRARPYRTTVSSLAPLRTSCDCPDFLRSSLGLCKHGLIVLDAIAGAPSPRRAKGPRDAELAWDPIHPLDGPADRLARLRLADGSRGPEGFHRGAPLPSVLADPRRRLAFIDALARWARRRTRVEPAVGALLVEERARATRALAQRTHARDITAAIASLKRAPYPYQREGIERFLSTGRLLLADDMGLGKTLQTVAACHALYTTERVQRGLLIVPASLKPQWLREWQATTDAPLTLVEGSPDERAHQYASTRRGFLAIGYEQLLRDFEHVRRFAPELVVLDEAQRIKNWATKSAAYVKALAPEFRLVLTGTPMENRFDELASIMDFVDDVALEPKWRLAPWHTIARGDGASGSSGARHLDTLRARLAPTMVRRVRQDVLKQLPSRTDTRVPVKLTDAQRDAHADLDQPIAVLLSKAARRPLTQAEFLRLMQLFAQQRMICNGLAQVNFDEEWPRLKGSTPTTAILDGLHAPKLAALRGLVEQIVVGQRRKAVVFSQWRNMLRLAEWSVRDLLAAAGTGAAFFTGAESPRQRERAIVDFHDDPATAILFLSDAGGVGLNLQRAATACINLELPWNPAVLEQRIGRIHRQGQTHPIDIYNLVAEDSIEARIALLIAKKQAVFSSLFDGTGDDVRFDGQRSFLEAMRKLLEPLPPIPVEAEADLEAGVEAAIMSAPPEVAPTEPGAPPAPAPTSLSVTPLPGGGLRIEAPPALAAPLAELLESLARSLRAAIPPTPATVSDGNPRSNGTPIASA